MHALAFVAGVALGIALFAAGAFLCFADDAAREHEPY